MPDINSMSRPSKSGIRSAGQLPEGNGSMGRKSSIAKEPGLPGTKGEPDMASAYKPAYKENANFKPSKSGGVR